MKPDRFYANEMQFSLDGRKKMPERRNTANEKLLIKMTTQLKLSRAANISMQ
jgi:hypothetical protein